MLAAQRRAIGLADWVILNEEEAAVITGQPLEKAGAALQALGPEAVVITQGKGGARLFSAEENVFIPAYAVPVIYDVGAGDTFQAGFVAGKSWGMSFADSVRAGAATAALRISKTGETENLPTEEAVKKFLQSPDPAA
jgi:2-dehydro-3-deoxygluconokinase